jgi:hypothetical protein
VAAQVLVANKAVPTSQENRETPYFEAISQTTIRFPPFSIFLLASRRLSSAKTSVNGKLHKDWCKFELVAG